MSNYPVYFIAKYGTVGHKVIDDNNWIKFYKGNSTEKEIKVGGLNWKVLLKMKLIRKMEEPEFALIFG